MPRKAEPRCTTEQRVFPSRLRELMEDRGVNQKELAAIIGMRPQTVSLYTGGQSTPDINCLRKIAEYFHVSTDWLIGLADPDNSTTDEKLRMVSEYTGLSNTAVEKLRAMKGREHARAWTNMLSCLISDSNFEYLLGVLEGYFAEEQTIGTTLAMSSATVNQKDFSIFVAGNTLRNILERVSEQFSRQGYLTTDERLDIIEEKKLAELEAKANGKH